MPITRCTICLTFAPPPMKFSSLNVSLTVLIFFMRYILGVHVIEASCSAQAGSLLWKILSTRNHFFLIACWLHSSRVERCFARPGPCRLKKLWALVEPNRNLICTWTLLPSPPSSPRRNWSSCLSWIPSTSKLVAARNSASMRKVTLTSVHDCGCARSRSSGKSVLMMLISLSPTAGPTTLAVELDLVWSAISSFINPIPTAQCWRKGFSSRIMHLHVLGLNQIAAQLLQCTEGCSCWPVPCSLQEPQLFAEWPVFLELCRDKFPMQTWKFWSRWVPGTPPLGSLQHRTQWGHCDEGQISPACLWSPRVLPVLKCTWPSVRCRVYLLQH